MRGGICAIDEKPQTRAVGVFAGARQIDGLHLGIAVARTAMRQKTRVGVSPKNFIEHVEPFFTARVDDRAPAVGERTFEQRRERLFKPLALQMVEPDFHQSFCE